MSDRSKEPRYPHLEFIRENISPERRGLTSRPADRPNRSGRATFGRELQQAADRLEQEQLQRPRPLRGINPHLVFRIPFVQKPDYQKLTNLFEQAGMSVVSIEVDDAIVVFQEDASLQSFRNHIIAYQKGPTRQRDGKIAATTQYDILEFIDPNGMRSWSREDRIGPRLQISIGLSGENLKYDPIYTVEMEIWHPGSNVVAKRILNELRDAYLENATDGERWLDSYLGNTLILAKVRASGQMLEKLLVTDAIALIDVPIAAKFDVYQVDKTIEPDFPTPPAPPFDGPRLCIIDSGIVSNHPLLKPYVGHEEAILTRDATVSDMNGHGTRVGALAVYGDIRECYDRGEFASNITLYSARVLNDRNRFDDEELIITQMRRAVETFVKPPYSCRIFNVSIGGDEPALGNEKRKQNIYGEILDIIAREYQVLFIVSAGNHREVIQADDVEAAVSNYPAPLLTDSARLCDFATTALGITVGALGESNSIAIRSGINADDIVRPVALRDQPAPMTRIGPGVQGAIKPDLVHYGGSFVFDRNQRGRLVLDKGMATMSFSHEPLNRLFAYDSGTSYAAPRVARLAALVEHQLREQIGRTPHPNLIRAILAASARIPSAAQNLLEHTGDSHAIIRVCGYGLPNEEYALQSNDRHAVLYAQSDIPLNTLHIYRVPVPDCMLQAPGGCRIKVALAFDPPVLARRMDYLGIKMDFRLIRGKTVAEVVEAYSKGKSENKKKAFAVKYSVSLKPNKSKGGLVNYDRGNGTLQCAEFSMKNRNREHYGNDYCLLIRSYKRWFDDDQVRQSYAVVVSLEANTSELYAQVRQRVRQQVRVRA